MIKASSGKVTLSLRTATKKKLESIITGLIVKVAKERIKEEYIPRFAQKAIEIYRRDLVSKEGAWGKKDPTSPSALESAFVSYINSNAQKLIKITKKGVYLHKKYLADFGFPGNIGKGETNKLKLLYFYFSGIIGAYGFVDVRTFEKMTGRPGENLGRFGKGFFMERSNYEKIARKVRGLPRFSQIESPLSGSPGVDIVARAFNESATELSSILKKAAKVAVNKFNRGLI